MSELAWFFVLLGLALLNLLFAVTTGSAFSWFVTGFCASGAMYSFISLVKDGV